MLKNSGKNIKYSEIVDLIAATKFNQDELEELYEDFIRENPSGSFDLTRFKDQFRAAGLPLENVDLFATEIFRAFDVNHDNCIDFREHLIARSIISRGNSLGKLRWLFCIFDHDKDGILSTSELLGAAQVVCNMAVSVGEHVISNPPSPKNWSDSFKKKLGKKTSDGINLEDFVLVAKNDKLIEMLLSFSSKLYV